MIPAWLLVVLGALLSLIVAFHTLCLMATAKWADEASIDHLDFETEVSG